VVDLAGVVLAAGAGNRLRPLTDELPKALCPVDNVPLLDHALTRLAAQRVSALAVNVHGHRERVTRHLDGRAHLSYEEPEALGTAGALGALRTWIDGRATLVTNADAYLAGPVPSLVEGWDGETIRLAVVEDVERSDFENRWRYCGLALMPWQDVALLEPVPSGLYEVSWRRALADGRVELVPVEAAFVDCGTPADYLRANLLASSGKTVVGEGAVLDGVAERCVLWPGARVDADEVLRDAVRTGSGLTVQA
jgi:NDP-sugar pyrophosphorylase family protein